MSEIHTECGCTDECQHKPECVFERGEAVTDLHEPDALEMLDALHVIKTQEPMRKKIAEEIGDLESRLQASQDNASHAWEVAAGFQASNEKLSELGAEAAKEIADLRDRLESARKGLQWIVNSPSAHPGNMLAVATDALAAISRPERGEGS